MAMFRGLGVVGALGLVFALVPQLASADAFGGFSGVDAPYLVDSDKVCVPLDVDAGVAKGSPHCQQAAADVVAKLSIKPPVAQRGAKATYEASATGATLTVSRKGGDPIVTWQAPDPIGKVVEVYATPYDDRVAVAFTTRRLGKEITVVVGFVLIKTTGTTAGSGAGSGSAADSSGAGSGSASAPVAADPPELTKAVEAARKSPGKDAAAWKKVLALEPAHAEALFRIAQAAATAKRNADALAALDQLAHSARADAIEWAIEARFDPAFAALRADHAFRAATALDRKPSTIYERVMGLGGQWEQTGTSCEKAEVRLAFARDRVFRLRVKTTCEGMQYDTPFKGTWRIDGNALALTFPPPAGVAASAKDTVRCSIDAAGDEDAIHCKISRDLEFSVLATRR